MPYFTPQELEIAAGGSQRLTELSDIEGSGSRNDTAITRAQTAAENWIHSYAQKRYAVPFNPVTDTIKQLALEETVYRLMTANGMVPDWDQAQHEERHKWLQDLSRGLVSPGVEPDAPNSTAVTPAVVERDRDEDISRESLKGFC